ncbi:uncharacterized protein BJX67DRAFT_41340 [Aspergillus lucknowensis]|uniref:Uncharacterized protein n=1 Tax=Aspergillus lucknowensis TaxID=176173 RepID=A0ABR4LVB3_9EURO
MPLNLNGASGVRTAPICVMLNRERLASGSRSLHWCHTNPKSHTSLKSQNLNCSAVQRSPSSLPKHRPLSSFSSASQFAVLRSSFQGRASIRPLRSKVHGEEHIQISWPLAEAVRASFRLPKSPPWNLFQSRDDSQPLMELVWPVGLTHYSMSRARSPSLLESSAWTSRNPGHH